MRGGAVSTIFPSLTVLVTPVSLMPSFDLSLPLAEPSESDLFVYS